jgi:hypothetical protein
MNDWSKRFCFLTTFLLFYTQMDLAQVWGGEGIEFRADACYEEADHLFPEDANGIGVLHNQAEGQVDDIPLPPTCLAALMAAQYVIICATAGLIALAVL